MSQNVQETELGDRGNRSGAPLDIHHNRKRRMDALALADEATLEREAGRISGAFSCTFLRRPEAGLVMVEGRAGNSGRRFNVGEMLVTRCVVRLEDRDGSVTEGYSFIQGNRPRHAELAAVFDALLQQEDWAEALEHSLIEPLITKRDEELRKRAQKTAATKVDFFTLVRGEDE